MAAATILMPRANAGALLGGDTAFANEWFNFFASLRDYVISTGGDAAVIQSILDRLAALEEDGNASIQGLQSVNVQGSLSGGVVQITLVNDGDDVGNTYYYGTGPDGTKGWSTIASAFTEGAGITLTVGADGVTDIAHADTSSVADITATFTGGTVPDVISITFDEFGHVLTRTISGRTLDHNDTGALQGGNSTERYHLSAAEHTGLLLWAGEDPADYSLITQTITNGDTTHSPSGDAVFDALAGKEPTITAGTTAQFWRGDKTWSDWLDGDFRLGQSAGIAGNGRELVISAGATANTLARIGLRGNRTGSGNVGAINFYNGAASDAQICGLAATQDGADDAGAFLISAKQTGVAAVNVLQISYNTARPRTDNTISLGLSSARWTELHTFNIAQYGARHETGVVSPAQITANTDNWAVTGLSTAGVIRASTDASRNLTGIASPTSGQALLLVNVGAFDLVLVHDATSTAANRFLCPGSANLTLNPNDSVRLWYDNTSSRWRVIGV